MKLPLLSIILTTGLFSASAESFVTNIADQLRIQQALPKKALAQPLKPRRLLIFTLNVAYGGHTSIAYANEAFTLMGKSTGAFGTVVTDDPAVFEAGSLKTFDAVFFNNTVGNCFTNPVWRKNLLEFVIGGGGLMGVHGTTVAFMNWPDVTEDWPEFGYLIGARGANHKDNNEHVWMKLDDAGSLITRMFSPQGFDYRDEFFRPQGTYSRNRVRVLLSMDTARTDPNAGRARGDCYRADNDYAVAWIRSYGRGRVFYCTIAHNPYVFWDSKMLEFYLAAAQFALGDLPCPTTPSAKVTPAVRVREKLGWRLAAQVGISASEPLYKSIESASRLGFACLSASDEQRVSDENPKRFGPDLSDAELTDIRLKLESEGLRLIGYQLLALPESEAAWKKLFEFARKMGIETFIAAGAPRSLEIVERLCKEYAVSFASQAGTRAGSFNAMLQLCRNQAPLIGVCATISGATPAGSDNPVTILKGRLLVARLDSTGPSAGTLKSLCADAQRLRLKPLFLIDAGSPDAAETVKLFDAACANLK
jgi:hypothetical protein